LRVLRGWCWMPASADMTNVGRNFGRLVSEDATDMAEVREAVELLRELHGIGVAPPASITRRVHGVLRDRLRALRRARQGIA